jgi:hypothetical protein
MIQSNQDDEVNSNLGKYPQIDLIVNVKPSINNGSKNQLYQEGKTKSLPIYLIY